ncbi:Hpt domain-containing protein [Pseudodesulfovibrio karagichevae]|uniref:Hpt domain-containing protein n=1 Tax=Pseudodesulfovibrio karagichevae TaxID=3239305 RepID=A0ABV4K2A4_9BACT
MNGILRRSGETVPGGAAFDAAAASADLGLTLEEFAPLLAKAAVEIRIRLDGIRQGLADGDLHAVALNSHTMKSVAATLAAEPVRQASLALELCAKNGDGPHCPELLAELELRAGELLAELDRA